MVTNIHYDIAKVSDAEYDGFGRIVSRPGYAPIRLVNIVQYVQIINCCCQQQ